MNIHGDIADFIQENDLLTHAKELGAYTMQKLGALKEKHPIIADVRGIGLFFGIELIDPDSGERAADVAERIMYAAFERGMNFKLTMGNIITLTPALVITQEEMDRAIDILDACFEAVL